MIALVLAAQASVPATGFAPPLDRPYRVVVRQERTQAGVTRRFETERRIVFHRDGAELVAEMTLVRVWQDAGGDSGQRYEAAAGALKGRTLRLHLAADGTVTAIDDEAAAWAAAMTGVSAAATAARGNDRTDHLARTPMGFAAGVADDRRRAMLASPLTSLIVGNEARITGSGPVAVAGRFVAGHSLTGTRNATIGADQRWHITLHAHGDDPAIPITLDRERVVDPATGLLVEEDETQSISQGGAAQQLRQHVSMVPVS